MELKERSFSYGTYNTIILWFGSYCKRSNDDEEIISNRTYVLVTVWKEPFNGLCICLFIRSPVYFVGFNFTSFLFHFQFRFFFNSMNKKNEQFRLGSVREWTRSPLLLLSDYMGNKLMKTRKRSNWDMIQKQSEAKIEYSFFFGRKCGFMKKINNWFEIQLIFDCHEQKKHFLLLFSLWNQNRFFCAFHWNSNTSKI